MTGFWPSADGKMPPDTPVCGFSNEFCDRTLVIAVVSAAIAAVLLAILVFFCYKRYKHNQLETMPWRIARDNLTFVDQDQAKSMVSFSSHTTKLSNLTVESLHHAVVGNSHVTYRSFPQRRPIKFSNIDLNRLMQMKRLVHDNINPFLGMCFNEKSDLLIVWKFCTRGSLQDLIYNDEVVLDAKFHGAFARDICLGLEYLHTSLVGYHGCLSSARCLIDRNWAIRLTDYALVEALDRWVQQGAVEIEEDNVMEGTGSNGLNIMHVLYLAPEFIRDKEGNKRRAREGTDTSGDQTMIRKQTGDIYAFGIVLYELLFGSLPFDETNMTKEAIDEVRGGKKRARPRISKEAECRPDLRALLEDCWEEEPDRRPTIKRVLYSTKQLLKTEGGLVDQMMRMMEQYANNLEKLVKERTAMLEEAQIRADKLLTQLLPVFIANELKMGRSVPPRMFKSSTCLFSDIVGFTSLCSVSSPIEIVSLLNGVYSGFDDIIAVKDAYKVETIGDAYMVVSGVPEENGTKHVLEIAEVALRMRGFLADFVIPHRRSQKLRCRFGFHTGAVAAGVVGLSAPRYCIFGDSVNFASNLESTGLAGMIQMSEAAHGLLANKNAGFICALRGQIDVKMRTVVLQTCMKSHKTKGRGNCITYWLEGKEGATYSKNAVSVDLDTNVKMPHVS